MEFRSSNIMFTRLATLVLLNLFVLLLGGIKKLVMDLHSEALEALILQIVLCVIIVLFNLPIFHGLSVRRNKGCLPSSAMSNVLASVICLMPILEYLIVIEMTCE